MLRLAINGYGRIGRSVLRALYESGHREAMQVVAINEPADLNTIAHLSKYDTTHGRFPGSVAIEQDALRINGDAITISHYSALTDLPWRALGIDVVLECSGQYDTQQQLEGHLQAGAQRVLLSQPGTTEIPAIVYGVNQHILSGAEKIISAASCSTNCIVPVIKVLDEHFGLEHGIITTIHSAMNDQPVLDAYHHTDLRKTRAAGQSIIPVETGLAQGVGRILPQLAERFAAHALRVPTINVSAMQLTMQRRHATTVAAVNAALASAAALEFNGILGYTEEPLASCDFNHDPHSGVVDASQTQVAGDLINVLTWFDNEWGYANRMLDVLAYWLTLERPTK
ncbi:MAG TPA: glyceraldehyde 3-phosphate dehydrogenase NAD-binding domain-containing protein [Spongiibacteraceae bacterium]|nr:glyceraldehyde 3-phosphate dehydrogenase NAD-binding domain-containing protein [Spongiibacteraceae bacterium]